ncbi:MAG: aminoglycoside phosphotransferase family protein [bacterium]
MTMPSPTIQPELAQKFTDVFGDAGRAWIAGFPAMFERLREQWDIADVGETYGYVGYAWVAPVTLRDGTKAVLKAAPADKEYATEYEAMRLYAGDGAARLIAGDPDAVAILLERIEPGTTLAELDDDVSATEIAGLAMRRLFRPLPAGHGFPTVERWGLAFGRFRAANNGTSGGFPAELFDPAERIYAELTASQDTAVLLHGDLHHWNILRAEREPWLVIDPKGVAGEPAYEVCALLRNRTGIEPDARKLAERRIAQLSDILEVDARRLTLWAFAAGVLSAIWYFEDHGVLRDENVELVQALLPAIRAL